MVDTPFEQILKEMEAFFNCPLQPDENQSCLIKMGLGISLQMEMNLEGLLLIGCVLGTLPMSRYRDNLFREALKSNDQSLPSEGVFAFSNKTNHLILFLLLDPLQLNNEKIFTLLPPFINKAKMWKEAIDNGETPKINQSPGTSSSSMGFFGLIR